MTNFQRHSIDEFDDISSIDQYHRSMLEGLSEKEALNIINLRSRDNSRTPFPWTSGENGGFSATKPWLESTNNFDTINAEAALKNPDSIYNFYKKMIDFRQSSDYSDVLIYGDFKEIQPVSDNVIAYKRVFEGKTIYAYFNFGTDDYVESIDINTGKIIFNTKRNVVLIKDGKFTLKSFSGLLIDNMEE